MDQKIEPAYPGKVITVEGSPLPPAMEYLPVVSHRAAPDGRGDRIIWSVTTQPTTNRRIVLHGSVFAEPGSPRLIAAYSHHEIFDLDAGGIWQSTGVWKNPEPFESWDRKDQSVAVLTAVTSAIFSAIGPDSIRPIPGHLLSKVKTGG